MWVEKAGKGGGRDTGLRVENGEMEQQFLKDDCERWEVASEVARLLVRSGGDISWAVVGE